MTKTFPVIFHNLKSYDSQLIMLENGKFDVKISVIPNGLEKYTAFTINNNSVFIDSMQCKYSSLDALVRICQIIIWSIYLKDLLMNF